MTTITKVTPFDLEKFKAGGVRVATRDGKLVSQLTYFEGVTNSDYTLCGVMQGSGHISLWTTEGKFWDDSSEEDDDDLVFFENIEY